jgi:membrane protease YdiL (CAAX protease family)
MTSAEIFLAALESGILASGIVVWVWLGIRRARGLPALKQESYKSVPWSSTDLLLAIVAILAVQLLGLSAATFAAKTDGPVQIDRLSPRLTLVILGLNVTTHFAALLAALAVVVVRARAKPADLGINGPSCRSDVNKGVVAFVAVAPLVYGLQIFFTEYAGVEYKHPLIESIRRERSLPLVILVVASAVIAAPVVEEFIFRVLLQGWLEKAEFALLAMRGRRASNVATEVHDVRSSRDVETFAQPSVATQHGLLGLPAGSIPIFFSSALFAQMHAGQGQAPVPLFFFALVLGFLYHRTHRVIPSITTHALLNAVSLVAFFVGPSK